MKKRHQEELYEFKRFDFFSSKFQIYLNFQELRNFELDPPDFCTVSLVEDNLFHWEAKLKGPKDSPFEGGTFLLDIVFPNEYPNKPPKILFKTKIYHPNIGTTGQICMDIIDDMWSPALTIEKRKEFYRVYKKIIREFLVAHSISSLLADPNFDEPLIQEIGRIYKTDPERYNVSQ